MELIIDSIINCPKCNKKLHYSDTEHIWFCTQCKKFFNGKFLDKIERKNLIKEERIKYKRNW
jgi:ribosomal protein L37AE/L43A